METGTLILYAKQTLSFLIFIYCTHGKPHSFFVNAPHVFYQYFLDLTLYLFASEIEKRVCILEGQLTKFGILKKVQFRHRAEAKL